MKGVSLACRLPAGHTCVAPSPLMVAGERGSGGSACWGAARCASKGASQVGWMSRPHRALPHARMAPCAWSAAAQAPHSACTDSAVLLAPPLYATLTALGAIPPQVNGFDAWLLLAKSGQTKIKPLDLQMFEIEDLGGGLPQGCANGAAGSFGSARGT